MATRYLTVDNFMAWARDDIVSNEELAEQAITAAEELLDDEAGRALLVVTASTTAEALTFVPTGSDTLWIPDAAEIDSVVENSTTLTTSDYQAEPLSNKHPATLAWRPFDRLVRLDSCWHTNGRRATVTVTAKWGWLEAEIPAVVVEACKVLASDWLEHRNVRLGVQGVSETGFSIGIRSSPAVRKAIEVIAGPMSIGIA